MLFNKLLFVAATAKHLLMLLPATAGSCKGKRVELTSNNYATNTESNWKSSTCNTCHKMPCARLHVARLSCANAVLRISAATFKTRLFLNFYLLLLVLRLYATTRLNAPASAPTANPS